MAVLVWGPARKIFLFMHVICVHVELHRCLRAIHLRVVNLNTYLNDTCFRDEDIITVNSPLWNRLLCYVYTCEMCLHWKRNVSWKFKIVHVISFYDN